ncbi:TIM barrel protein [Pedobacter sp. MC2016-14]|uniref:sugar phosphate isomerase/epimerase family protein n=1 Tax=Pedobacter sp. MC2016-14 TaxID=2897327 RepID=UPI001E2872D3|nr:TIM barrel protein [Pedobacter sp. MC2016-14]MCD0486680.1 TIM barrel protein [Pedobacter sp. MC2016-14]
MDILFFCTRWGSEHLSWRDFAQKVKEAGYDGIEASLPVAKAEQQQLAAALAQYELKFIGVHWDTVTADYHRHRYELEERLQALIAAAPLFITSHTGKDHFSFEQNSALLNLAEEMSGESGISILHETHRGKFSFAAHLTKPYLEQYPWLKLTLDISHWYAVAESYLQDQQEAVELALQHTAHIHSRVGFTQGPQVPDPRAEEWQEALNYHLKCWDKAIVKQKNNGATRFTFTSEFGPFPYMSIFGKQNDVLTKHQWELNNYMKDLLKTRYHVSGNQN